jgi:putative colanic acid biosynthesis UDP-glucose lipid carrier transferase
MISGITSIHLFLNSQQTSELLRQRSYIDNKKSYFILKRAMDFFISLLFVLFILSWLSIIIALLIIMDSRGPVFFVQRRVGKAGRSFPCYKFRTMFINPDADTRRADLNDPRITRFGKMLRLYNIDELPQFFNVFLGHMSIVGPRPHMHSDCYEFSKFIPGYKFRTFVKPGITGLAQAKGYHGPVTDQNQFEKRFHWDAFYVRNASVELDIRIMHATLFRRIKPSFTSLEFS